MYILLYLFEYLSKKNIQLQETSALLRLSGGDARKLLNIFELVVGNEVTITVTNKLVLEKIQKNTKKQCLLV